MEPGYFILITILGHIMILVTHHDCFMTKRNEKISFYFDKYWQWHWHVSISFVSIFFFFFSSTFPYVLRYFTFVCKAQYSYAYRKRQWYEWHKERCWFPVFTVKILHILNPVRTVVRHVHKYTERNCVKSIWNFFLSDITKAEIIYLVS